MALVLVLVLITSAAYGLKTHFRIHYAGNCTERKLEPFKCSPQWKVIWEFGLIGEHFSTKIACNVANSYSSAKIFVSELSERIPKYVDLLLRDSTFSGL